MLRKAARRRRISGLWGSRGRGRSGIYPFHSFLFCQRWISSFSECWRTVLNCKLDRGSPCLVPFFWYRTCWSLRQSVLWLSGLCTTFSGSGCNQFDTARFDCFPNWFVCDGVESLREVDRCCPHFDTLLMAFLFNHSVRRKVARCLVGFSEASLIFRFFLVKHWVQSSVQNFWEHFVQRKQ